MFLLYGAIAVVVWILYLGLPDPNAREDKPATPLGPSRGIVWQLGGAVQRRFLRRRASSSTRCSPLAVSALRLSLAAAGAFFFWTGLLAATSQLLAAPLARRIGLVNTMVFTHLPSSVCLIAAALAPTLSLALALLLVRSRCRKWTCRRAAPS